jgi:hypothetical protein
MVVKIFPKDGRVLSRCEPIEGMKKEHNHKIFYVKENFPLTLRVWSRASLHHKPIGRRQGLLHEA